MTSIIGTTKYLVSRLIDGNILLKSCKRYLFKDPKSVQNGRKILNYVEAGGVAAAVLSSSGRAYTGVCVDTCSTLGICAERNAIFNMLTNGEQEKYSSTALMISCLFMCFVFEPVM